MRHICDIGRRWDAGGGGIAYSGLVRILLSPVIPLVLAACGTEDDMWLGTAAEADVDVADELELELELELRTNSDPDRLVVYSNNIENMIFDWKDLVHEMEEAPLRPDIFLVQQVSGKRELDELIAFMRRRLGVRYEGVVAQNVPDDRRFSDDVTPRPRVTTGIIWRARRFDLVTRDSWRPFGTGFKHQPQSCDARSDHSGYETLRVKLHDKRADEDVVAVSLRHWTWHPCSSKNVREIVEGHDGRAGGANDHAGLGGGAALHIVGGDFNDGLFNQDGSYKCWYRMMNGEIGAGTCNSDDDFGFTDPLFESCDGDKACVKRRAGIDSLFVRRSDGGRARTSHFDIIGWDEAHRASVRATGGDGPSNTRVKDGHTDVAGRYSGHMARRAYVHYR